MPPSQLPSLNAVRSFVAAGRLLSFTAAARELNVTQGAVSRMVHALEAELGVPLFSRVGRGIALTAAGAAYHQQVSEALDRIAAAGRSLRNAEENGILTVSALPTFAMRWLVPRLPAFQRRHPELLVNLVAGDGEIDFARDRFDMAVRFGRLPHGNVTATRLMEEETGVICAPSLVAGRPVTGPADLLDRPLLQHTTRPRGWQHYFSSFGLAAPDMPQAPGFEHLFMLVEAAAAGMGMALMPLFLVQSELATGRLVQPVPHVIRPEEGYYILHRPGAERSRKVQLFKAWLLAEGKRAAAGATIADNRGGA